MTGKAKEYLDLWETDQDPPAKAKETYDELFNKVKDYARRRKMDTNAKERMQQGGDPMDLGAVGGWDYENYDYDQDGVYAIGFKGKGKRQRQSRVLQLRRNWALLQKTPTPKQRQGQRQRISRRTLQLRRNWPSGPRAPQNKADAKGTWSKGGYMGAWSKGGLRGKGK